MEGVEVQCFNIMLFLSMYLVAATVCAFSIRNKRKIRKKKRWKQIHKNEKKPVF